MGREDTGSEAGGLELSVRALDPGNARSFTRSKTLLVSPSGQCSTMFEDDEENDHFDDERQGLINVEKAPPPSSSSILPATLSQPSFGIPHTTLKSHILSCFQDLHTKKYNKRVDASKDVLSTYHESFLYGTVPLTTQVRAAVRGQFWSNKFIWLESIAAVISLAFYVRSTYTPEREHWIAVAQILCSSFFVVDYIIKLYSAPVRLYYMFSPNGIVDFISMLPLLFIVSGWTKYEAVSQVLLMLRVMRAMPIVASLVIPENAVSQEIFLLVVYTFGAVFIAAGILQWVELKATSEATKHANGCGPSGCIDFYQSFYFMIVTISTVGYGDVTLKSDWGRFVALCTILVALILLPLQVNKILELASFRPYGGRYAAHKNVAGFGFIIISGNLSYPTLQDFLSEFYHPSHNKDLPAFPLRVVILAPFKPSFELKALLAHYKGHVDFIEGTPLKDSDLERTSADLASAFFLLADQRAKDPDAEDAAQIVRTLSVQRYCGPNVRVIVEVLKPENKDSPIWDDAEGAIEVFCPEAIRFQLLARSCDIKGLSTFLINLFKHGLKVNKPTSGHWIHQYYNGLQQGIYPIILPSFFSEKKLLFEEAAEIVYVKYESILFGLDILLEGEDARDVVLCPAARVIQPTDVGLVIAKDLAMAEKISEFGKKTHRICTSCCRLHFGTCGKGCKKCYKDDESIVNQVLKKRRLSANKPNETILDLEESTSDMSDSQHKLLGRGCESSLHKYGSTPSSKDESSIKRRRAISFEEAAEIAMCWPPVTKQRKPDPAILERRADVIEKNLEERTISAVNFDVPHVLLCMQGVWPSNLFYFVQHLRTSDVPGPPVAILHPHQPSTSDWGYVGMFEDVYFVNGSPMYELDLIRAGVLQAEKVVILRQSAREDLSEDATYDDFTLSSSSLTLDVQNMLVTATVERLLHPIRDRVIVELQREVEIHYLRPKFRMDPRKFDLMLYQRNRAATYMFAPAYIEGKGFCSASLSFLLYALFFNGNTIAIVERLLSRDSACENNADGASKKLEQILVPKAFVGKTYIELFIRLLREGRLALGLYRTAGTRKSIVSYVYTHPSPKEVLESGDLLYVLQ